jgi:hypothetical protein
MGLSSELGKGSVKLERLQLQEGLEAAEEILVVDPKERRTGPR